MGVRREGLEVFRIVQQADLPRSDCRAVSFLPERPDHYGRLRAYVYRGGVHAGWLLSKDGLARPVDAGGQVDWCG